MLKVVHFQRKRLPTHFSVEGYFARVREGCWQDTEVSVTCMPFLSKGLFRRLANALWAIFHQADVNHITGDITYVAAFLRRNRNIVTILDCQVLDRLTGWRREVVRFLWFQMPVWRSTYITVISEETKRTLLQNVRMDESRIRVIPVSVSTLYTPSTKDFDSKCPRILQVGTKVNKNVARLLEAISGLPAQLVIVGPIHENLQTQIDRLGVKVENLTNLSDQELAEQYFLADLVAFVSTHEGFGMPIVEAQFVERAVITSNCSSMPEVAGKGACLVDPHDVNSIRDGLKRLMTDSNYRDELIALGRVNRERFSQENIAEQFRTLYKEIRAS